MKTQCKKTVYYAALLSLCTLLPGCGKYYLSLTQQNVDVTYLSSVHANTPDPRQEHPPVGEMIIMDWRVPKELIKEKPHIELHVIYWDYTEKIFSFPIDKRMGYVTYKDLDEEYTRTQGILTYKADIKTADGKIYKEWKHQLWVNLITLDEIHPPVVEKPDVSFTVDNTPMDPNSSLEQLQEQELQEGNNNEEEYEAPQPPNQSSSQQQLEEQEEGEKGDNEEQETLSPSLEQQEEEEYEKSLQPATKDAGTEESNPSE